MINIPSVNHLCAFALPLSGFHVKFIFHLTHYECVGFPHAALASIRILRKPASTSTINLTDMSAATNLEAPPPEIGPGNRILLGSEGTASNPYSINLMIFAPVLGGWPPIQTRGARSPPDALRRRRSVTSPRSGPAWPKHARRLRFSMRGLVNFKLTTLPALTIFGIIQPQFVSFVPHGTRIRAQTRLPRAVTRNGKLFRNR